MAKKEKSLRVNSTKTYYNKDSTDVFVKPKIGFMDGEFDELSPHEEEDTREEEYEDDYKHYIEDMEDGEDKFYGGFDKLTMESLMLKDNYEFILGKHQETFTIKNRFNNSIIYETEAESLKDAVEQAVIERVSLRGATLERADLRGAGLKRADFRGTNLRRANFRGAYLEGADLKMADFKKANLREADLERADLKGADLEDANLEGAKLREANLEGANLVRTVLIGATLGGANLARADFIEANLEGADLRGADLRGADLYGAKLVGAIGLHLDENYEFTLRDKEPIYKVTLFGMVESMRLSSILLQENKTKNNKKNIIKEELSESMMCYECENDFFGTGDKDSMSCKKCGNGPFCCECLNMHECSLYEAKKQPNVKKILHDDQSQTVNCLGCKSKLNNINKTCSRCQDGPYCVKCYNVHIKKNHKKIR